MGSLTTCWDLLEGASQGDQEDSTEFCNRYRPLIVDYLSRRWRGGARAQDVDDAVQETLIECLKERGAVERAVADGRSGFRGFLHGVTVNVARRFEQRGRERMEQGRSLTTVTHESAVSDDTPDLEFDRAWARNVLAQARLRLRRRALANGERPVRRVELLALRFDEGIPVREVARRWKLPAAHLHKELSKARDEFRQSLIETLRFECRSPELDVDMELSRLLESASRP